MKFQLKAGLLIFSAFMLWPLPSHALLKELTPALLKEAIKWGEQYQLSESFLDRFYRFGPTEQQTVVLIATKYYQVAKAAALAANKRQPLSQEEIDKINKGAELEVRFQINYQRPPGIFELFFPRPPALPELKFQLKQGGQVVEPSRVEPPALWALTSGGTFRVHFPYAKIRPRGVTNFLITTPQGEEEEIKLNFSKLK